MRSIDFKLLICLAPRGYYIRGYSSSVITPEAPHMRSSNGFVTPEAPHLLVTPEALTPEAPTPEVITSGVSSKHISTRTRERCVFWLEVWQFWQKGSVGKESKLESLR